jgi:hypothetical protein
MEIAGLRGERVRLVPSEPEQHLDNAIRWFNDPEITNLLDKCGYHHEGTARKLRWRNGQWLDAQRFAILEEDYFLAERDRPAGFVNEMPSG